VCTERMTLAPSPTAAATRFNDPARTSPTAKTPGTLVSYISGLRASNVHISPILLNGRTAGMLCVEDPQRGDRAAGMAAFCDALSILLALRFAAGAPSAAAVSPASNLDSPAQDVIKPPDAAVQRQARLERILFQHNASLDSLGKGVVANAAVGVVKLPDWTTVVQQPPDASGRPAMDAITKEMRDVVERSDVSYAALLDDEIVLAAFSSDPAQAPRNAALVAIAMLEMRDRLTGLEDKWGIDLDFRFAMDVGSVMASAIASDPPNRNLWGGAVSIAKILAATAARHTIAASETAYELLASQFLLRPRGIYFLPETGNMRTFIMLGRL